MSQNMKQTINDKLKDDFLPSHLSVDDESHMHSVPEGAQSHFKVVVVSDKFDGETLIKRHRLINKCLATELQSIHALAIHAFTPEQWQAKQDKELASPLCHGGGK